MVHGAGIPMVCMQAVETRPFSPPSLGPGNKAGLDYTVYNVNIEWVMMRDLHCEA